MKLNTFLLSFIIFFGLNTTHSCKSYDTSTTTDLAHAAVFGAIVTTCGYSIYKVGEWIFSKTDEELYDEACDYYGKTEHKYRQLITTYCQEIYCPTIEHLLTRLPIDKKLSFECYLYQMQSSIETLKDYNNQLECRKWRATTPLLNSMNKLQKRIDCLIKSLNPIYKMLSDNKAYFIAKQLYKKSLKEYEKFIHIYQNCYLDDSSARTKKLNKLFTPLIQDGNSYRRPFGIFVSHLGIDIKNLQKTLEGLYGYPILEQKVSDLIKNLKKIRAIVKMNKNYTNEKKNNSYCSHSNTKPSNTYSYNDYKTSKTNNYVYVSQPTTITSYSTTTYKPAIKSEISSRETNKNEIDHELMLRRMDQYQY